MENIAAGNVPENQTKDPFWCVSARNLLSEIFLRCQNNEHVWAVLAQMSMKQLRLFLGDSMFN